MMKKILFLFFCLSLGFASCSSDDDDITPYLNIENESITIPYNSLVTTIKIKTNEEWVISNISNWGILNKTSGKGDADILFSCLANESNKDRSDTLTIKTTSFSKKVIIKQEGDENIRQGDFAKIISSDVKVMTYLYWQSGNISGNNLTSTGNIDKDQIIKYIGSQSKFQKNIFGGYLNISEEYTSKNVNLYIYYDNYNAGLEKIKGDFANPFIFNIFQSSINTSTYNPESNITIDNFSSSISNNTITFIFKNFKAGDSKGWNYVLNGTLKIEFI